MGALCGLLLPTPPHEVTLTDLPSLSTPKRACAPCAPFCLAFLTPHHFFGDSFTLSPFHISATLLHISMSRLHCCIYLCPGYIVAYIRVPATWLHISESRLHCCTNRYFSSTEAPISIPFLFVAEHLCSRVGLRQWPMQPAAGGPLGGPQFGVLTDKAAADRAWVCVCPLPWERTVWVPREMHATLFQKRGSLRVQ